MSVDWDKRNLRTVSTHVSVQDAERFRRYCTKNGTTPYHELHRFVMAICRNEWMREVAAGRSKPPTR